MWQRSLIGKQAFFLKALNSLRIDNLLLLQLILGVRPGKCGKTAFLFDPMA